MWFIISLNHLGEKIFILKLMSMEFVWKIACPVTSATTFRLGKVKTRINARSEIQQPYDMYNRIGWFVKLFPRLSSIFSCPKEKRMQKYCIEKKSHFSVFVRWGRGILFNLQTKSISFPYPTMVFHNIFWYIPRFVK